MSRGKVLALIMAGGAGSRLEALTARRAKPVLPYAGVYHLIDFPLSNCMHSEIADVWVIEQYQPLSLNEHLANGRPWDLDRTYGGLRLLQPYQGPGDGESGWHQGNADAIYKNRRAIRQFDPEIVLVLSADHVYQLDYRPLIERHREWGADVTMVTTRVPLEEAGRFGTVQVDGEGRVTGFEYKPDSPRSDVVTTEVFVYHGRKLLDTLEALAAEAESGAEGRQGGEPGQRDGVSLEDFGDVLLPRMVDRGRAYEHRFDGYWRDVGTIGSYWQAHMDLLAADPRLRLDDPSWPLLTRGVQRSPARVHASARIDDSLISPGCTVRGRVVSSVLGPGVAVEEGATVRHAVLLGDCTVGAGATIDCAIVDEAVRVGEGARIGEQRQVSEGRDRPTCSDSDIALVGQGAQIAAGARVPAGGRVEPEG